SPIQADGGISKFLIDEYAMPNTTEAEQKTLASRSSRKEARFQYINDRTNFQIVMRIGDNIDDFNAFASYDKLSEERRKLVSGDLEKL
ncbi:unnamed protein product, partial [Didymodactylos carnosus]